MWLFQSLLDDISLENKFPIVETTGVRGSTLARLATVSVWQRAINRQPGSTRITRRAGAPLSTNFSYFSKLSQKTIFRLILQVLETTQTL